MGFHDAHDDAQFAVTIARGLGQGHGSQPVFSLAVIPLDVDVGWFGPIAGEEEEPVWTLSEDVRR